MKGTSITRVRERDNRKRKRFAREIKKSQRPFKVEEDQGL
jgi:hypothetical protein